MSGAALFLVGAAVTLIVAGALVLLVYAAVLDGRDAAARNLAKNEPPLSESDPGPILTARAGATFADH